MGPAQNGLRWLTFRLRVLIVVGLGVVLAVAVFVAVPGPLPQNAQYHRFADDRPLLGIPNCLDVLSNAPFVLVGVLGLRVALRRRGCQPEECFPEPGERLPYVLLFLGIFLTGFGSAYYHLKPDNDRLVWDRLPMALAFMSLFDAVIGDQISRKAASWLLLPLVAAGVGSVLYWHAGETHGSGDLRPYVLVQFYPLLAIPLMLILFPPRYTGRTDLFIALGWYVLGKVLEELDGRIFTALHGTVSGHTLKHLASAAGAYGVYRMVKDRRLVDAKRKPAEAGCLRRKEPEPTS